MTAFKRVLFPFDFSESARAAAPSVAAMVQHFQAELVVLNAFDFAPDYVVAPRFHEPERSKPVAIPHTEEVRTLRNQRVQDLERFVHSAFADLHFTVKLEDGDPVQVIEWVVRHEGSDLIMMPTRGMGRFRRLLLGSVTAKILHDMESPVWTSAHSANVEASPSGNYQSILCAVGMGSESEATLRMAGRFARSWGARLCLLHVASSLQSGEHSESESVSRAFDEAMGRDRPNQAPRVHVLQGIAPEGIRQAALEERTDLLIIGRGHFRNQLSRSWSHVYEMIRESPCPVLSV